jgi:hypothetical protein
MEGRDTALRGNTYLERLAGLRWDVVVGDSVAEALAPALRDNEGLTHFGVSLPFFVIWMTAAGVNISGKFPTTLCSFHSDWKVLTMIIDAQQLFHLRY